jgi:hypothetical protein
MQVNLPILLASHDVKHGQDEDGYGRPVKDDEGDDGRYEVEYGEHDGWMNMDEHG